MVSPIATAPGEITGGACRNGEREATKHNLQVRYVCEREHRPVEHGQLEFDLIESRWPRPHSDARVQKMAECFLTSYLTRKKLPPPDSVAS
jgi:hypothetical protein